MLCTFIKHWVCLVFASTLATSASTSAQCVRLSLPPSIVAAPYASSQVVCVTAVAHRVARKGCLNASFLAMKGRQGLSSVFYRDYDLVHATCALPKRPSSSKLSCRSEWRAGGAGASSFKGPDSQHRLAQVSMSDVAGPGDNLGGGWGRGDALHKGRVQQGEDRRDNTQGGAEVEVRFKLVYLVKFTIMRTLGLLGLVFDYRKVGGVGWVRPAWFGAGRIIVYDIDGVRNSMQHTSPCLLQHL